MSLFILENKEKESWQQENVTRKWSLSFCGVLAMSLSTVEDVLVSSQTKTTELITTTMQEYGYYICWFRIRMEQKIPQIFKSSGYWIPMALYRGFPVVLSQTTVVSLWLVMPMPEIKHTNSSDIIVTTYWFHWTQTTSITWDGRYQILR